MRGARRSRRVAGLAGIVLAGVLVLAGLTLYARTSPRVRVLQEVAYADGMTLDIYAPTAGHGRPVLVMLHGCCGSKEDLSQLALGLATRGAVVFNATWRSMVKGGRYPVVYQQAACAVRFARGTAARYGGKPRRVTLLGWSDGAMLAAVVANAGDHFRGDCRAPDESALPDAVVSVGGFLGWPVTPDDRIDARYVTARTVRFFGGVPARAPAAWANGNPYTFLGRNRRLEFSLVVAAADPLLGDNRRFLAALHRNGHRAALTVVAGSDPLTLISPRTDQGRTTIQEALRVAR